MQAFIIDTPASVGAQLARAFDPAAVRRERRQQRARARRLAERVMVAVIRRARAAAGVTS